MKAVHTYVPTREGFEFSREIAHNMLLSVLYAQIHYKGVELYTNEENAKLIKEIGIPYDKIITDVFEDFNERTFSIPKILTYSVQNEEYVHLDLDTFAISKIDCPGNVKFFYAHPDIDMRSAGDFQYGINMYQTYLKNTYEIRDKIPDEIKKHIDFNDIPNMNVFGARDFEAAKKAASFCLKFYQENKDFFDSDFYNACIIEQLLMPAAIKHFHGDFYKNHYLIEPGNVFRIKHGTKDHRNVTYPLEIFFDQERLLIDNEDFLYQFVKYDYRTIVHLGGFRNMDVFQFLIKETIIERFNALDKIKKINRMFKDKTGADEISDRYYVHLLNSVSSRIKEMRSSLI